MQQYHRCLILATFFAFAIGAFYLTITLIRFADPCAHLLYQSGTSAHHHSFLTCQYHNIIVTNASIRHPQFDRSHIAPVILPLGQPIVRPIKQLYHAIKVHKPRRKANLTRKMDLNVTSVSRVHWLAYGNPLWQNYTDYGAQVTELQSVTIKNGKIMFYGMSEEEQARIRLHLQPYKHFNGVEVKQDTVDHLIEFDDEPLDWSQCDLLEPKVTFLTTVWMPSLSYHVMCDHVLPMFAMVRSANKLPSTLRASQTALKHGPLFQEVEIDPDVGQLVDRSHGQLFLFDHLQRFESSSASKLLTGLFNNELRRYSMLSTGLTHCFPRIRWGRGPYLNYFRRVNPFPTKLERIQTASVPEEAAVIEARNFESYTRTELGQWYGIIIEFHNYMMSTHGRRRRVRPHRDYISHEPLPAPRMLTPDREPTLIYIKRGKVHQYDDNYLRGRFLNNSDEVLGHLRYAGFNVVECCDWNEPWEVLLAVFQQGDIMFGLHGAGLTNLLFMPPGGIVVELQTIYGFETNFFEPLADHMDHLYVKVDVREYFGERHGYHLPANFTSDLAQTIMSSWNSIHTNDTLRFRHAYPH